MLDELYAWAKKKNFLSFYIHQIQRFAGGKKTGVWLWEVLWIAEYESRGENRIWADSIKELQEKINEYFAPPKKKKPKKVEGTEEDFGEDLL